VSFNSFIGIQAEEFLGKKSVYLEGSVEDIKNELYIELVI
jgi:hypothetical protein